MRDKGDKSSSTRWIFDHLLEQLMPSQQLRETLLQTSTHMLQFMHILEGKTVKAWKSVIAGIEEDRLYRKYTNRYPYTIDDALLEQYNTTLKDEVC